MPLCRKTLTGVTMHCYPPCSIYIDLNGAQPVETKVKPDTIENRIRKDKMKKSYTCTHEHAFRGTCLTCGKENV